ncbi:MAG: hypothetical protein IT318_12520 [Anaerolineales bacterium]|nr:hypothetical protein [Anaerolineales bacterium]
MKRVITVTDLTRMYAGYVCVAGLAEDGEMVRLSAPRPHELEVLAGGQAVFFPSAVIECDLQQHRPEPPHTEDYRYDPDSVRWLRRLDREAWRGVLEGLCYPTVAEIFEQPIQDDHGWHIPDGSGPRSLGSLRPVEITRLSYEPGAEGSWGYRLRFSDASGARYNLKITDYVWHRYCSQRRGQGNDAASVAAAAAPMLRQRDVILRLGLARKWAKFPGRCYLQINGIHTFPDYLAGKTLADLEL